MKTPEQLKGVAVYMDDDAQCEAVLKDAGKLDMLLVPPGKYSATACFGHDGWWMMATQFAHHDDPGEDGYTIVMLPQANFTKEQAAKMFMGILDMTIGREHLTFNPWRE